MSNRESTSVLRGPVAGLLAWVFPGLGHFFLGHHAHGLVFMVTIVATFWTGVALGGVRATVDPKERTLWFTAQMCTGANALAAYGLHHAVANSDTPLGPYLSSEVGVHYTGVAGLLNILVILDAIGRATGSRRQVPVPMSARVQSHGAGPGEGV